MERYDLPLTLDIDDDVGLRDRHDERIARLKDAIALALPLAPAGEPYQDLFRARGELVADGDVRYASRICTAVAANRAGEVWRDLRRAAWALE